ncbi:hypothetical protein EVAR_98758_1 [Eumeta japonica]|uniref:Uncharacterized protein n=1 Tax=Eumeta variegata TaxID=151549 RepID=A0A4C1YTY3_EUMVA|nr:hypothetical protein EVAR_98758_1 [Eumeta japonica]
MYQGNVSRHPVSYEESTGSPENGNLVIPKKWCETRSGRLKDSQCWLSIPPGGAALEPDNFLRRTKFDWIPISVRRRAG